MWTPLLKYFISFLYVMAFALPLHAQTSANSSGAIYYLNVNSGSFLPQAIRGVTEVMPFWGLRFGHSIYDSTYLEYSADIMRSDRVTYRRYTINARRDIVLADAVPIFVLLGFDMHHYKPPPTTSLITGQTVERPFNLSGGWHTGFGFESEIYGGVHFRSDVRMGFGPGRHLSISAGLAYHF